MTGADPSDATHELIELLGLAADDGYAILGSNWFRVTPEPGRFAADVPAAGELWFASGEPMQVLVGVDPLSQWIRCHVPVIEWQVQTPVLIAGACTGEGVLGDDPNWLGDAITRAATIRRRSFRWCRMCRTLNAPEHGGNLCHSCMQTHLGVTF